MSFYKAILLAGIVAFPLSVGAKAADIEPSFPSDPVTADDVGLYLRADAGWSFLEWSGGDDDDAFMLGAGIGYRFSDFMRTDLTIDFSGDYDVGGKDISTTVVMGNAYLDFKNSSAFTPYVGIGAGYGFVSNNSDGFALGLAAGVAVDVTENLAVDAGYRFRDIMASGPDVKEHIISAGMRFSF